MFTSPGLGGHRLGHGVALPSGGEADSKRRLVWLQSLITCSNQEKNTCLNLLIKSYESREHTSSSRLTLYQYIGDRPHKGSCCFMLT